MFTHLIQLKDLEFSVERSFPELTWEKLLFRWMSKDLTHGEAISWLFAGTQIKLPDSEEKRCMETTDNGVTEDDIFLHRLNFYLKVASSSDGLIAATAQQLIVKHWLREGRMNYRIYFAKTDKPSFKIQELFVKFLETPRKSLMKPPYPRFIAEYLSRIYKQWSEGPVRSGGCMYYQFGLPHPVYDALTVPFVRALIRWGLSHLLLGHTSRPEVLRELSNFLLENKYDARKTLVPLVRDPSISEPLQDISFRRAEERVIERAALVLLTH